MPVYTWDKGDRQCHCAPPCDSMDAYGRAHVSVSLLLQQARQRGPAKGWKVVFVSRSRPHTVLHSLVPLGVFSHWQMPVWQSGPCSCCWGPQSSLTRGGARLLKNQQQWRNKLPSACLHLSSEKDVLISKSSLQEAQWISSVKSPRFSPHWFKARLFCQSFLDTWELDFYVGYWVPNVPFDGEVVRHVKWPGRRA